MKAVRIHLGLALLACGFLCGCFDVEDELTIKPDGSGSVVLKLRTTAPEEVRDHLESMSDDEETPALYPPTSESEAERFFPPSTFKVSVEEADDGSGLTVRAEFKSVQALLNSPYGRAHQLLLHSTNAGELVLTALPAGEALGRAALVDPKTDLKDLEIEDPEALIRKRAEMKFTFRTRLPGAVAQSNGQHQGPAVTWAFTRAGCKDDAEFLARLSEPITATCSLNTPLAVTNPVRLALTTWTNLPDGVASVAAGAPSAETVIAAAQFVPQTLRVSRLVNLSGDSSYGGEGNRALLSGHVELPPALTPKQWGPPKVTEATDNLGNSLLIKTSEEADPAEAFARRYGISSSGSSSRAKPSPRQAFTLTFRPPEWKAKTVALVKGEMELTYAGGVEVLKMKNVIPTNAVVAADPEAMSGRNLRPRTISDPRLARHGLALVLQAGVVHQGATMLRLECSGKTPLLDLQVFDRNGRPWPTGFAVDGESLRVVVPGKPAPPLSLALALGSGGTSIKVPFQFEQIPTVGSPAKEVTP